MVWTALTYNPVRLLGMLGLTLLAFAGASVLGLVLNRLQGNTTLQPWQVAALFAGLVAAISGISVFSLGITFNYLVSLFYKQPVRQGLFGRPLFKQPLDRHFWWLGGLTLLVGIVMGTVSVVLSMNGWQIARVWLYLLGSAMLTLVGLQLIVNWVLLRVLDELSQREALIEKDLQAAEPVAAQKTTEAPAYV
jgi:hypothetical protein